MNAHKKKLLLTLWSIPSVLKIYPVISRTNCLTVPRKMGDVYCSLHIFKISATGLYTGCNTKNDFLCSNVMQEKLLKMKKQKDFEVSLKGFSNFPP